MANEFEFKPVVIVDADKLSPEDLKIANEVKATCEAIRSGVESKVNLENAATSAYGKEYTPSIKVSVKDVTDKSNNNSFKSVEASIKIGREQNLTMYFKKDKYDEPSSIVAARYDKTVSNQKYAVRATGPAIAKDTFDDTLKKVADFIQNNCMGKEGKDAQRVSDNLYRYAEILNEGANFKEDPNLQISVKNGKEIDILGHTADKECYVANLSYFVIPEEFNGKKNERAGKLVPSVQVKYLGRENEDKTNGKYEYSKTAQASVIKAEYQLTETIAGKYSFAEKIEPKVLGAILAFEAQNPKFIQGNLTKNTTEKFFNEISDDKMLAAVKKAMTHEDKTRQAAIEK